MGTILVLLFACLIAGALAQTKWGKEFAKDC